jgi:cytoskeleton protein RodZ
MFEIGNSLREARLRQGLDLTEIEQATKIRSRYLRALEEEQFELLPAQTYVKGFLKAYADQLGLDGDLYVEEFNSRYATGEEEPMPPARSAGGGSWPRPVRFQSSAVLISLTAIGLATALVIVAWRFGATGEPEDIPGLPPVTEDTTRQATRSQKAQPRSKAIAPPGRRVSLVASAVGGRCWLEVHRGSEAGELVFEGTIDQGTSKGPFTGKRLWLNVGAPSNLVVKVNGKRRSLPGTGIPREVIVNRKGISLART